MGGREKLALAFVAAVLLAAGAAGCGGDDDSTSPAGTSAVGQADSGQGADSKAKPGQDAGSNPNGKAGTDDDGGSPAPGAGTGSDDDGGSTGGTDQGDSGGGSNGSGGGPQGSKGFLTPGGDNSVQKFGTEASGSQFAAASAAVEAFMAARADHDWPAACRHLAAGAVDQFEKIIAPGEGCAATLTKASKNLPENGLPNTMTGPIDSFRVEGGKGFALWHGNDGVDYVLPMTMEGGWKLTLFEPTALGSPPPS